MPFPCKILLCIFDICVLVKHLVVINWKSTLNELPNTFALVKSSSPQFLGVCQSHPNICLLAMQMQR